MKKLDTAGVLIYAGLAGLIGALVLNMVVVILWSLIFGASPVVVAGVEAVAMSEESELHHWLAFKLIVAEQDDKDIVYHVAKAFALATDPKHKSALDGLLREHIPEGHLIHAKNTLKELLGNKPEPPSSTAQLEARLALVLVKGNRIAEAQEQVQHTATVAPVPGKEVAQEILEALTKGDLALASRRLIELSGGP